MSIKRICSDFVPEKDLFEHRITKLEDDVKILYSKVNNFAVASAEMHIKLDSMLVTLGELKESIQSVKERPSQLWDKLVVAMLTAIGTGVGAAPWLIIGG